MRDILFRAKTKQGEWVYGSFINSVVRGSPFGYIAGNNVVEPVQVMRKTIGQFTGLTDKNGEKIFEGDIIKQTFCIGQNIKEVISVVEYGIDLQAYCVCQRFSDGSGKTSLTVQSETGFVNCEIIGNIHDQNTGE